MSKNYTITLTDAQDKALSVVAASQQEWIENAVFQRCQVAIEEIVNAEVQRKLAGGESISGTNEDIVMAADGETVAERNERVAAEMAAKLNP